ncbi:hypothetical protein K443DRAFT_11605 [Laccaria amethystina LaAM-08-1]|uniref:Uncharacterized protein n=1 Tax=Laccaria amethystina LaAM-08-1 TaxID=1095629 RepID=A0A0C9XBM5_9AGAR|nr:hypothetical protein K443DRAFT_11605 [Laccaria amethystina LaAM-08-1]
MEPPPFINPPARALDRLIQIADAPLPIANALPDDPNRFIQRPLPPSLKDSTAFPQWKKAFEDLANDGPAFTVLLENVEVWLTTVQSHASPSSQKKRRAMEYRWEMYVNTMEPGISGERIWHSDVILKYGQKFLPNHIAHGSKGRKSIKASTLQEYMMLFSWCIARNSRDPETAVVNGISLLTKKGMLNMLNDQLHHLIRTSNLDRHQDEKVYFGRYEIKLMIEVGLRKSATSGRMIAIRSFCILLTCFYTSVRPGSLGFTFNEYLRDGKFPILDDIQVFCISKMTFKVKLAIKNFKGFNTTVEGQTREYWLTPIQNWENVTFDAAFWYVLYLFLRGALVGINTMDDLRNHTNYSLPIKEEKKHEPLHAARLFLFLWHQTHSSF